MKRNFQTFIWTTLLLIFASCDDPDTDLPAVEITVVKNGLIQDISKPLYGNLSIEANASDNGKIKLIKLIYESSSIAESTNDTLTFLWNTRMVEDGEHMLTVYVEDMAGNFVEKKLELNISNFLLSFSTVDFVAEVTKYYVFLSDHQGNLLEFKLLEDRKEKAIFTRPETESDTYQLSVVFTFNNHYWINTYVNVPPDNYFVKSAFINQPVSVGKHTVVVPDRNTYSGFFIESENGISFNPVNNFTQYDISLSSSTSNLFLGFYSSTYPEPIYYFDPEIKAGEITTVDNTLIAQFKPMSSTDIDLSAEQSSFAFALVFGNTQKRSTPVSFTSANLPNKLKLYYPPISIFKDFTTQVYYSAKVNSYDVYHHLVQTTETPVNTKNIVLAQINSLASYTTANLKFGATGTADFIHSYLRASNGPTTVEWNVYGPMQDNTDISLPGFPEQFLTDHNLQFLKDKKFTSISFSDIPTINSYSDFVAKELKKDFTGKNVSIPDPIRSVIFQIPN
jgi:hypothetical protein